MGRRWAEVGRVGRRWAAEGRQKVEGEGGTVRITNRTIGTLKATSSKGTRFYDDDLRGFTVRVMPDGSKHFEVRYGGRRNRRRLSIGHFGTLTIDEARQKARSILAEAELGHDPAADRDRERNMPTFAGWRKTYTGRITGRLKSAKWIDRFLGVAEDKWASRRLDTITPGDVESVFQTIGETSKVSANRWAACVRACFEKAVLEGHLERNPAKGVAFFLETPRERTLTDAEMTALLEAVMLEQDVHARAGLRLLVESGCRLSEILTLKWDDVDLEAGTLTLRTPKAGRPQVAPISKHTIAMLKRLPHVGLYVVAGREDEKPRADLKGPWGRALSLAAKKAPTITNAHVHDLRRTMGKIVARQSGLHLASKVLRHTSIKITEKHYSPMDLAEIRAAVERRGKTLAFPAAGTKTKKGTRP